MQRVRTKMISTSQTTCGVMSFEIGIKVLPTLPRVVLDIVISFKVCIMYKFAKNHDFIRIEKHKLRRNQNNHRYTKFDLNLLI